MSQPKCNVCGRFIQSDYVLPNLCETHYEEAWQVFMHGDDAEQAIV